MSERKGMGYFEAVFDAAYLLTAYIIGALLLVRAGSAASFLAGITALVLAGGDSFHLVPRICSVIKGDTARFQKQLGIGKQITSITMTVFYVLLWNIGLLLFLPPQAQGFSAALYALAAVRILLCLLPQNRWTSAHPPFVWGVYRNLPFVVLGAIVAVLFGMYGSAVPSVRLMWLAIALSFGFYIPVTLGAQKHPLLGMLMLPKTLAYVWILVIFLGV